jgi:tetratricopeptide (TPR) repeat protein
MGGAIPATLQDSLTARLDGMGPAREIIRIAAVLGREFPYALILAVAERSERELREALGALIRADLIVERGSPPHASYRFEHALIQDAAYEGLLKTRRRDLHRRAAVAISQYFPTVAAAQPQLLARHWTLAGEPEPAVAAWTSAGDAALARRAFREAEDAYHQAGIALAELPGCVERDRRELSLCERMIQVRQQTRGYAARETLAACERARTLAEAVGDPAERLRQEVRAWSALFVSGDYSGAAALSERMTRLTAGTTLDERRLAFTHHETVQARFYTGDLAGVEAGFANLDPLVRTEDPYRTPGEVLISMGIPALGALAAGRAGVAWDRMARARSFAEATRDPYALVMTLLFESYMHRFQQAPSRAAAAAGRMLTVSEENAFSYAGDLARGVLGWARAACGQPEEGVVLIRRGLNGQMAGGAMVGVTDVLTRLAEAQWLGGGVAAALDTIERALTINHQERIFQPNALVVRGGLRQELGEAELAKADYAAAVEMAMTMGGLAWALRAGIAYARLTSAMGDDDAARDSLAAIMNALPEDSDAPDLLEAGDLLARLRC